jgi:hypothetical protein
VTNYCLKFSHARFVIYKIILIVGPIDRLTYARKYFIFGKFSNNCQIKIFDHCSHCKFSLSSRKIPFLFFKYWYGDFSNYWKGILNPYLYYALNFPFQTLSRNSPGYISEPQHFDFNKRSVTNYCLKFSHARFVI